MARSTPRVDITPAARQTSPLTIGRRFQPTNLGLLKEAIYFYNFAETGLVRKRRWAPLHFAHIAEQLDPLRVGFHAALYQMFARTMAGDGRTHRARVRRVLAQDRQKPPHFSQDAPRLVLKACLSPAWRQTFSQKQKKRWSWIHIRYLDELVPRLVDLRQAVDHGRIETVLGHPFSDDSPIDSIPSIFGFSDGITELIYKRLAGHFDNHPLLDDLTTTFTLHEQVREQTNEMRQFVFPLTTWYLPRSRQRLIRPWTRWEQGVDALENKILRLLPTLYGKSRQPITYLDPIGAWGLTLCAILRAFIVDMQAQVLMYALPLNQLYHELNAYGGVGLWEAVTGDLFPAPSLPGYLALPERWSHDHQQSETDRPQAMADTSTWQSSLADWVHRPFLDHWFPPDTSLRGEPANSPFRQYGYRQASIRHIRERLQHMSEKPAMTSITVRKNQVQEIHAVSYTDLANSWHGFPAITYRGIKRIGFNYLNNAASLVGQAHLYVANYLLAVAVEDLGLTLPTRDEQQDVGDKLTLQADESVFADEPNGDAMFEWYENTYLPVRGYTHTFTLGSGSLHYDGKHPPHKTHRDGATYDINFGHDHRPWPYADSDAQKAIQIAIQEQSRRHPTSKYRYRIWKSPLMAAGKKVHPIVGDHQQLMVIQKGTASFQSRVPHPTPSNNRLVFRSILGRYMKAIQQEVGQTLRQRVNSDDGFKTGQTLLACVETELLRGFPHFVSPRSVQRTHLCHTALVLAGAKQLIYGSPIAHFRVLRSIREGLYADGSGAELVNLVSPILRQCHFVFMPADHHNHWHVHFVNLRHDPHQEWQKNVEAFVDHLEFWLMLGVDFSPFIDYLGALQFTGIAEAERTYLLKALKAHQKHAFDPLYSLAQPDGVGRLVQARRVLHRIFLLYNDAPYVDTNPTETEPFPYGNYGSLLKTTVEQSEFLLEFLAKHDSDVSLQKIASVLDEAEKKAEDDSDEAGDNAPEETIQMPSDDDVEASETVDELEHKMSNSELEKIPTIQQEKKRIRQSIQAQIKACLAAEAAGPD